MDSPISIASHNQEAARCDAKRKRYLFGAQGRLLTVLITTCGSLGFMLFGMFMRDHLTNMQDMTKASLQFLANFGYPDSTVIGTINSIYNVGCFCGAVLLFFIGEPLGRKKCIYLGGTVMAIGAILQCSSYSVTQMIVARVITGAGNGINTSTFPVWVSKLAHAKSRGRLVSIEGNLIALGIVIASFFDIGMSFVPGQVQWRLPVAFQLFFIISTAVMAIWLPESPRWLCARGRHHEAIDVLAQIKGRNMPMSNPDVLLLKQTIDDAIALEAKDGPFRFAEVFTSGPLKIRRRFLLAIGLQCMQQISGINVMVYYFPRTLETTTGFQHLTSLYLGAALAITYWVASFIPCIFLDRMFRRWPLIWGAFICGICFMIAGVLQPDPTPVRAKASITFFFIYEFVFGIGWLPIPWLFPSEISPTRYRSHAAALATASDWIFNFVVVQITPISISNIGWQTYIVFFVLNMGITAVVYLFYPDTTGLTLEQVDYIFKRYDDSIFCFQIRHEKVGLHGEPKTCDEEKEIGAEAQHLEK